jgi:uncharacterized membrane protein YoaK (UPF0700 family)
VGGWLISTLFPVVQQPGFMERMIESSVNFLEIAVAVLGALLSGLGEFIIQQPAILGWSIVMVGVVTLWSGVYRQLTSQPVPVRIQSS